ncbi:YigZ family protein [Psychrobium sp. 1_MG-2023]|uniref:YigZ family protein n=1 Tax=Psychrobium sp. 1_MG-2023 TaxID=3062624 RepID=UPI000C3369C0|nr:YigZ family protein [Psychrobium sp. 1_MG-2023]MDP2560522.1 YigZ family protein [Psychrobium sp. 1_MG-2023]PKF53956.1 YigZ family protein [Alteromonadales bacterium alter-6D02]
MKDSPYQTLSAPLMVQTEVKRSKFLAYLAPTSGVKQAKEFIASVKKLHPDANHNCWAFVAGRPDNSIDIGFSDDGEPSGCAGRPMLNVLQGSDIGEITVVVSRYFGGIKLGTGGMARAYGAAVNAALAQATTIEKVVCQRLSFSTDYQWTRLIEQLVKQYDVVRCESEYGALIQYQVELDIREVENFTKELFERSNGSIVIKDES